MNSPTTPYYSKGPENSSLFYEAQHHNPVLANHWESQHQYGLLTPPFEEAPRHSSSPPQNYHGDNYYNNVPRSLPPPPQHQQYHLQHREGESMRSPFPSPSNSPSPSPRFPSSSTPHQHQHQQQQEHHQEYRQERHEERHQEHPQHYFHANDAATYYSPIEEISPSYPESPFENNAPPREDSDSSSPDNLAYRIDRPDSPCKPFVAKLAHLLMHPELYSDVVRWDKPGTSFVVNLNDRFINTVIPEVFSHNSITAFRRQLNTYGFNHLTNLQLDAAFLVDADPTVSTRDLSAWSHPFFSRDIPGNLNKLLPRPSRARRAHQSYKLAMMLEGKTGLSLRSKVEEKKKRMMSLPSE